MRESVALDERPDGEGRFHQLGQPKTRWGRHDLDWFSQGGHAHSGYIRRRAVDTCTCGCPRRQVEGNGGHLITCGERRSQSGMSRVRPQDRGGLKDHQYTSRKRMGSENVVSVAILYAQKR
jgi:hypothetical protein